MNSRQIEKILESYFNGETSLEEEKKLNDFFSSKDIPPHLKSLKAQFDFFSCEKGKKYLDEDFDHKILSQITFNERFQKREIKYRYMYLTLGVAVSVLIIMSIFFKFDPFSHKIEDTFNDPMAAYLETKKAFLFISEKLNSGINPIEKVSKIDKGVEQLSKISILNTGIEKANVEISKFYKNQQKILK